MINNSKVNLIEMSSFIMLILIFLSLLSSIVYSGTGSNPVDVCMGVPPACGGGSSPTPPAPIDDGGDDGGGSSTPVCVPHSCSGCKPKVPAGYTSTNNGCKVTIKKSCKGSNGCSSCTITKKRWLIETNVTPPDLPNALSMIVDGDTFQLSTEASSPTTIKYPSTESNVQISLPSQPAPPTSDGLGYHFRVNNYGLNNEWIAYTDCINPRPEDFCSESTNNIQNFIPSSYTVLDTLKQGAEGKVSGMYYTVNRCDDGKLYSLPIETYYKVDNIPEPRDVCEWNPALLASDPECEDPGTGDDEEVCTMEEDLECTKKEFFTNIGDQDSTSSKGCYSEDYTGIEVNNPLKIRVGGVDKDGVDEIKGAVVWFSKSNNTPTLPLITETYSSTSTDDLGILILQDGADWNNPKIYGINSNNTWGRITDGELINSDGQQIASISEVNVTKGEEVVTFELELLFLEAISPMSGMYSFKTAVLDEYMILDSGETDISHMIRHFNWGIDLQKPTFTRLQKDISVIDPRNFFLNWEIDGTASVVTDVVINAYRQKELINDTITLSGFPNEITLLPVPGEDSIGYLTGSNSWIVKNAGLSSPYISTGNNKIYIGDNQGGVIVLYTTAYDQGCNDNLNESSANLTPWIATKGGIVYSKGNLGSIAPDLDDAGQLDGLFRNLRKEELDTGTELISSRESFLGSIRLRNQELGAVRALNTYDSNDRKGYWYEYLNKKLNSRKESLASSSFFLESSEQISLANSSSSTCGEKENCVIYSSEDITINESFLCDKNTLVMSEKDIILNPNIIEPENTKSSIGCIYLAKEDILIEGGNRVSTSNQIAYDYIEGFLIADNQIFVKQVDLIEDIRDGLEIKGGFIAMGSRDANIPSILLERNLRLYNMSHPTLVLTWDIKYARLSEVFFGTEAPMYKQEVGFKLF